MSIGFSILGPEFKFCHYKDVLSILALKYRVNKTVKKFNLI
jgi:hypothetical protein